MDVSSKEESITNVVRLWTAVRDDVRCFKNRLDIGSGYGASSFITPKKSPAEKWLPPSADDRR